MNNTRNFVIIAHVDHGKSTLADRLLEATGTVEARRMRPQYLDQLELERERGITIKMAPVRMVWHPHRGSARMSEIHADQRGLIYEDLTYKIRGAFFAVYNALGPGQKEVVYQRALELELGKVGVPLAREKRINVVYDGTTVGTYQPDFVADDNVIIEIKALPFLGKLEKKQTWYYLKGSPYKLALLVNFGGKKLEIERIVYDSIREDQRLDPRESAEVEQYVLNLIDTPGHSDFSYEVSRALAAVEGAVLLVDATKGIQAQTLSNFRAAKASGLTIIGAVNKIDLLQSADERGLSTRINADEKLSVSAHIESVVNSLAELMGVPAGEILRISGKTGEGVPELLERIVEKVPSPSIRDNPRFDPRESAMPAVPSRALIFDSLYDDHKGILAYVRVFDGEFRAGDEVRFLAGGTTCRLKEVGYFAPELKAAAVLRAGDIGYLATGLKQPELVKIGDTILTADVRGLSIAADKRGSPNNPRISADDNQRESAAWALPGYKEPSPVVFISFYPDGATKFDDLKRALERLRLTDAALSFEPDSNEALGRGMKVGFLGQLHAEIIASRLEREFNLQFLASFPSIAYRVRDGADSRGRDPSTARFGRPELTVEGLGVSADERGRDAFRIVTDAHEFPANPEQVFQPMLRLELLAPSAYLGAVVNLKQTFDLEVLEIRNIGENVVVTARMPLSELIHDFDDQVKSVSAGYASFSYELDGEAPADVEKLEILIAGEVASALTRIVPRKDVEREGRATVERLKKLLPREQFVQALQARALGRIIARETIPALKKDVTGYLYGGDRTRKMKLWKKQQRGKERLKERARVRLSVEVFREILKK